MEKEIYLSQDDYIHVLTSLSSTIEHFMTVGAPELADKYEKTYEHITGYASRIYSEIRSCDHEAD